MKSQTQVPYQTYKSASEGVGMRQVGLYSHRDERRLDREIVNVV